MFGIAELVWGTKELLPLIPPIVKVLRELQNDKDPSLMRALVEVRIQATEACKALRQQITALTSDLGRLNIDSTKSLSEIYGDLSWFKDFPTKMILAKHRRAIADIHIRLSGASDDLASVLLCKEKVGTGNGAYDAGASVRKDLDAMAMNEPSLQGLLAVYAEKTDEYIRELHP